MKNKKNICITNFKSSYFESSYFNTYYDIGNYKVLCINSNPCNVMNLHIINTSGGLKGFLKCFRKQAISKIY